MAVLLDPTFGEWLAFIRRAAIRLGKSKKPPFQAAAALLSFDDTPSTKTRNWRSVHRRGPCRGFLSRGPPRVK
jgi:hypothetical protein